MYLAYTLLLVLLLLVTLPYWLLQMLRSGKYRTGLTERFGRVPKRLRATELNENCIWVHAVSVGEVLAVGALVNQLKKRFLGWRIIVSTTTLTGQKLARDRFGGEDVFFFPLDLPFAIRPFLAHFRPKMAVIAETEFWPNFLFAAREYGARAAVVNARISDHSFPRYKRARALLQRVLRNIDLFLAQSDQDRERLIAIGAAEGRVQVSGNLKFDIATPATTDITRELRTAAPSAPILVCGSTVEGEEPIVLGAFKQSLRDQREAVMILAPRHPERFEAVATLIAKQGLSFVRRSAWEGAPIAGSVLLLDSIGELASIYSIATIAFVGGSLVPRGGHNILEPAQFGKPIIVGPHTENFRDIISIFATAKAIRIVEKNDLTRVLQELLASPELCEELGNRALEVFRSQAGATQRTLDALEVLMWMPSTMKQRYGQVQR